MPHFTLQNSPQGPVLDAFVGVSQPRRTALLAAQQPVPDPIRIRGLVDTGASGTCVDPSVTTALQLTPTGQIAMATPSTGTTPHMADQFDITLAIPHSPTQASLIIPALAVSSCQLVAPQGFHALIGRDVLEHCILSYNGSMGWFSLAY